MGLLLARTGALVLSVGIAIAGASTKFSRTEDVTDDGSLVVDCEEESQKRFASVDDQLDASATVASPNIAQLFELNASVTLTPDDKGRAVGTLTLGVDLSPGGCTCGGLHVEYFDMPADGRLGHPGAARVGARCVMGT